MKRPLSAIVRAIRARGWGALPLLAPGLVFANPTDGVVVGGAADISASGNTLNINQLSPSAAINWQSFSIGANEYVTFNQPSSSAVALNRVVGGSASEILGHLTANGQVFIVNPMGVLFGKGAVVDVGGLLASTLDISHEDFMAGRYKFAGLSTADVLNAGNIRAADGGYVVFLGDHVANSGAITANLGTVLLASGSQVTLDLQGDGLVNYALDAAAISDRAGVENLGTITADGGHVVLDADVMRDLKVAVINNAGLVQARKMTQGGDGSILLVGRGGDITNSGTLDASSTAPDVDGGHVVMTADGDITMSPSSVLRADGGSNARGGVVRVIGDGKVALEKGALISATGGKQGGFAELSGHKQLTVRGDVELGNGGTLLIDPTNVTIASGAGSPQQSGSDVTIYEEFVENQLQAQTNLIVIADRSITLEDLVDDELNGTNGSGTGGKLVLGIGTSTAVFSGAYGAIATENTAPDFFSLFQRGGGQPGGGITFVDASLDVIRTDGGLRVIGGSNYGDLTLGGLETNGADADIVVTGYGAINLDHAKTTGANSDIRITSEHSSVNVAGELRAIRDLLIYADSSNDTVANGDISLGADTYGAYAGHIIDIVARYGSVNVDTLTTSGATGYVSIATYGAGSSYGVSTSTVDSMGHVAIFARGDVTTGDISAAGGVKIVGDATANNISTGNVDIGYDSLAPENNLGLYISTGGYIHTAGVVVGTPAEEFQGYNDMALGRHAVQLLAGDYIELNGDLRVYSTDNVVLHSYGSLNPLGSTYGVHVQYGSGYGSVDIVAGVFPFGMATNPAAEVYLGDIVGNNIDITAANYISTGALTASGDVGIHGAATQGVSTGDITAAGAVRVQPTGIGTSVQLGNVSAGDLVTLYALGGSLQAGNVVGYGSIGISGKMYADVGDIAILHNGFDNDLAVTSTDGYVRVGNVTAGTATDEYYSSTAIYLQSTTDEVILNGDARVYGNGNISISAGSDVSGSGHNLSAYFGNDYGSITVSAGLYSGGSIYIDQLIGDYITLAVTGSNSSINVGDVYAAGDLSLDATDASGLITAGFLSSSGGYVSVYAHNRVIVNGAYASTDIDLHSDTWTIRSNGDLVADTGYVYATTNGGSIQFAYIPDGGPFGPTYYNVSAGADVLISTGSEGSITVGDVTANSGVLIQASTVDIGSATGDLTFGAPGVGQYQVYGDTINLHADDGNLSVDNIRLRAFDGSGRSNATFSGTKNVSLGSGSDVYGVDVGVYAGAAYAANLAGSLNATTLTVEAGSIDDGTTGALTTASATFTADALLGDITLDNANNDFGTVSVVSARNVSLRDATALELDAIIDVSGAFAVYAGDAITQTAASIIHAYGTTYLDAGAADITLDQYNNDFVGAVSASAHTIRLRALNAIQLDNISADAEFGVSAGGDITQTAASSLHISGGTFLDTSGYDITLDRFDNDFGRAVSVGDANTVRLRDINDIQLGNINTDAEFGVSAGGDIAQSGTLNITGGTFLDTTTGHDITLDYAGNNFIGSVTTTGRNITLHNSGAINLGNTTATGFLSVTAENGDVTNADGAHLEVTGNASFNSNSFAITLGDHSSDVINFGTLTFGTSGNVDITEDSSIDLTGASYAGDLTLTAQGHIAEGVAGTLTVNGATSLSAYGAGNTITLNNANDFSVYTSGNVDLYGSSISVNDINFLPLGDVTVTSGDFTATAGSVTTGDNVSHQGITAQNITIHASDPGTYAIYLNGDLTATAGYVNLTTDDGGVFNYDGLPHQISGREGVTIHAGGADYGQIAIGGHQITSSAGYVSLTADVDDANPTGISVYGAYAHTNVDLKALNGSGQISFGDGGLHADTGYVSVVGQNINYLNSDVHAHDNVTIEALSGGLGAQGPNPTSIVSDYGYVNLTADNGAILLNPGNETISGYSGVTIHAGGDPNAPGSQYFTGVVGVDQVNSSHGYVSISSAHSGVGAYGVHAYGDIDLLADTTTGYGNIAFNNGGLVSDTGHVYASGYSFSPIIGPVIDAYTDVNLHAFGVDAGIGQLEGDITARSGSVIITAEHGLVSGYDPSKTISGYAGVSITGSRTSVDGNAIQLGAHIVSPHGGVVLNDQPGVYGPGDLDTTDVTAYAGIAFNTGGTVRADAGGDGYIQAATLTLVGVNNFVADHITLTGAGPASLSVVNNFTVNDLFSVAGGLSLNAGGDLVLNKVTANSGDVGLTASSVQLYDTVSSAGHDISVSGDAVYMAGDLLGRDVAVAVHGTYANGGGYIAVNADITATGYATLTTDDGSIGDGAGVHVISGDYGVTIHAGGASDGNTFVHQVNSVHGYATLIADADNTGTGYYGLAVYGVSAYGNLDLRTPSGQFNLTTAISGGTGLHSTTGYVSVLARNINYIGADISAGTSVSLHSTGLGGIQVDGLVSAGIAGILIQADDGGVSTGTGAFTATNGPITLIANEVTSADDGIFVGTGGLDSGGGAITLKAADEIFLSGTVYAAGGNVNIHADYAADGTGDITGSGLITGNLVTLSAAEAISVNTAATTLNAHSDTGGVTISETDDVILANVYAGGTGSSGAGVSITAGGNILDDGNETTGIDAGNNPISMTATTGNIGAMTGGSGPIPTGAVDILGNPSVVDLYAGGGYAAINFASAPSVSSRQIGTLAQVHDLLIGVYAGDFHLDTNRFDSNSNADPDTAALNLDLRAKNIGFDLDTSGQSEFYSAGNLSLNAFSGNITDASDNNPDLDIVADVLTIAATGTVAVLETGVNSVAANNTDLTINQAGDVHVNATNLGNHQLSVTTQGSIFDDTDQLLTAGRIEFYAGTGIGNALHPVLLATPYLFAATTSGSIFLSNTPSAAVHIENLTTGDSAGAVRYSQVGYSLFVEGPVRSGSGGIGIDPPASITFSYGVDAGGGSFSASSYGDIIFADYGSIFNASAVTLTADANHDYSGAIIDAQTVANDATDITASGLVSLSAYGGIGAGNTLEIDAPQLSFSGGGVDISDSYSGGVQIYGSNAGSLSLKSNGGAVSQDGTLTVTGGTFINAGAGSITLTDVNNDFQGAVALTGGTTQVTDKNSLSLSTLNTGALTLVSTGALSVNSMVNVAGALSITTNGGNITEPGSLSVTGAATLNAGAGSITLNSIANNFQGALKLSAASADIKNSGALNLGGLTMTGDLTLTGALSASSGGILTLAGPVSGSSVTLRTTGTSTGDIVLNGDVTATSGTVVLSTVEGGLLGAGNTISGNGVNITTRSASVGPTAGAINVGTVYGGTGNVVLTADGNVSATTLDATGHNLTVVSNNADIQINGTTVANSLFAQAYAGDLMIYGGLTGTDFDLYAGNNIDLDVNKTGYVGHLSGHNFTASAYALDIGSLTYGHGFIGNFTGAVDITARSGAFNINYGDFTGGSLALHANGGSLGVSNTALTASAGNIVLAANGDVTFIGDSVKTLGNVQVAGVNISTTGTTFGGTGTQPSDFAANDVSLYGTGTLGLNNTTINTGAAYAQGASISSSGLVLNFDGASAVLRATAGSLSLNDPQIYGANSSTHLYLTAVGATSDILIHGTSAANSFIKVGLLDMTPARKIYIDPTALTTVGLMNFNATDGFTAVQTQFNAGSIQIVAPNGISFDHSSLSASTIDLTSSMITFNSTPVIGTLTTSSAVQVLNPVVSTTTQSTIKDVTNTLTQQNTTSSQSQDQTVSGSFSNPPADSEEKKDEGQTAYGGTTETPPEEKYQGQTESDSNSKAEQQCKA